MDHVEPALRRYVNGHTITHLASRKHEHDVQDPGHLVSRHRRRTAAGAAETCADLTDDVLDEVTCPFVDAAKWVQNENQGGRLTLLGGTPCEH